MITTRTRPASSAHSVAAIKAYKEMQAYAHAPQQVQNSITGTYATAKLLNELESRRARKKMIRELLAWLSIFAVALPAGALLGYSVHLFATWLGIK